MSRKFHILIFIISTSISLTATATVDISKLTKVTAKSNKPCVEYYSVAGKLYCSQQPLSSTKVKPIPHALIKFKLFFKQGNWHLGWWQNDNGNITVEYVPQGESVDNYQQMVTTQFFKGAKISPVRYANNVIGYLKQHGYNPHPKMLRQSENDLIFQFRITEPKNQVQDELQRVIKTKAGLYVIHYVIKKPQMNANELQDWLQFLSNAQIID